MCCEQDACKGYGLRNFPQPKYIWIGKRQPEETYESRTAVIWIPDSVKYGGRD